VTQYESNLFYYYESGAISESLSDVWGEYYDQENGTGSDGPGYDWLIGEDVAGVGALRSMSDPTIYYDPDSMLSYLYRITTSDDDNGGVHTNSGVNNKAVYLMVHGGTHNYITTAGIGWEKTAAIYYDAATNLLTSGADYADLYSALYTACQHLVGGAQGITSANCQEVRDATDAVQMKAQPAGLPNFNTDVPLCDNGQTANTVFFDNIESGTTNWTFAASVGTNRWGVDSPDGPFAHSGQHSLYANDRPATADYTFATLKAITIPAGAYLHFSQAYGFEDIYGFGTFDGGVLGYSTNGGSTWLDAGPLFVNNGYNGTIDPNYDNPLRGRPAFVGDSHGYISSRLNLSSLAGKSVLFSWRMGLDTGGNDFGWWVDDVRIYTCGSTTGTPTATVTPPRTSTPTPSRTPTAGAPITITLTSVDTQDGWIRESSETSGQGGTVDSTSGGLRVGDSAADQQYRSIVSFDTAQLPDNAVIQSVKLRLKYRAVTGTNPYSTHGNLTVDLKNGAFSGDRTLQAADFQASASKTGVMSVPNTPVNGWYSASLGSGNFGSISLLGVTQFRLRFVLDDNDDLGDDFIAFNSGNALSDRPQLIVTYSVP
jgi:hypothetical protein